MYQSITVLRHERVALLRDGRYLRLLGPGRHTIWSGSVWTLGALTELVRYDLRASPAALAADDPLPDDLAEATVVTVSRHEVGVLRVEGRDSQVLLPGRYRLWRDGPRQEIVRFDVLAEPVALATDDVLDVGRLAAWVEASADGHSAVVLLRDGKPVRALAPGRYRTWGAGPWSLRTVSRERQVVELSAQDLVTQDQVPVRVKAAASVVVVDPVLRLRETQGDALVYGAVQLALREVVAAADLDGLTQARVELSTRLLARARAALPEVGLALAEVWVKDVILPGEVKDLVHRVTLARKEAEALSIKRREEVAATRQLANTAKLLEQSPVLLRLKELEAMGELVGKIDKLVLVGGADLMSQVSLRELARSE